MRAWLGGLALIVVLALALPAAAHKVILSVYASGGVVEGEVGFSNGEMAKDTLVEVFDHEGTKLGEVRTDEEGFFTFHPTVLGVHVFRADLGAGHVAEAHVTVETLPGRSEATPNGGAMAAPAPPPALTSDAQRALIAEVVREEVRPLRRELAAYKEKNDLQAILGGIGYVVGLFGVGYFLAARHRLRKG